MQGRDAALDDLRGQPAAEAAATLAAWAADHAATPSIDAAMTALLADRRDGDPILEHLPLEALEPLARRCAGRIDSAEVEPAARHAAWQLLDVLRRPAVLGRISDRSATGVWSEILLELVERSHFTFGHLFQQRAAGYGERTLFELPGEGGRRKVSWRQAAGRVDLLARSLLALTADSPAQPVGILSRNRLDMALVDLACLTSGIVNVVVPANATETDVAFILEHAGVGAMVVSDREQLQKVMNVRDRLPRLGPLVALDSSAAGRNGVIALEQVMARSSEVSPEELSERRFRQRIDDLASIMYTSGTTGTPKGICFTQRNIVFKRFARALALPEIGENDRFLCYLPLFHTFGRFLEMTGCIFWGATYCFADDPSIDSLSRQMRELGITVFISVPLKWMQLYELVRQSVDVVAAADHEISTALRELTGPSLRWGLSAAGYLDPEVFRFFQRNGVELMSGFGMTEATGGITMTPPGRYKDDSLGPGLPGIETDLAPDGEMVIRGPYVMRGYLDPPDGAPSFDDNGWFHTGDLMERDEDGYYRIVDRKKEIYKNVHGETIAPQKIENLFRDFDSVGRIFLVGDHRPYNTALIYPNPDFEEIDLAALSPDELKDHFRSLVVSANSFLAPYERIIDFAITDRDFDADRGELTPKGTYRRKTIERAFSDRISLLYRRRTFTVGGAGVVVPNWFFQALGVTAQDLRVDGDDLQLTSEGTALAIRAEGGDAVRVGSAFYSVQDGKAVDLGHLLSIPRLWLGNEQLVDFAPLEPEHRNRRRRRRVAVEWLRRIAPYATGDADDEAIDSLMRRQEVGILDVHRAALLLASDDERVAVQAVKILDHLSHLDDGTLSAFALRILRRAADSPLARVRQRAFQVLSAAELDAQYPATLTRFFDTGADVLDDETVSVLVDRDLSPHQIECFIAEAEGRWSRGTRGCDEVAGAICGFLSRYGSSHPSQYRRLRGFFTRSMMIASNRAAREIAAAGKRELADGFRRWLGAPSRVAVDPETDLEYRWEDVVEFSDEIEVEIRDRVLEALRTTPVLREASFLFGASPRPVRLEDILPGGVWIRLLGTSHGKSVYRVAVRTRDRDQLDIALNLNRRLSLDDVQEEINWLIVCSESNGRGPLVEIFGGWWHEHELWTEEFIPGETLDRALARLARKHPQQPERMTLWWPFAAWSAVSAYVDFWHRTGRRLVVADPSPANVIVPMHDYHTGARLVSISSRAPHDSLPTMLRSFHRHFIEPVEAEHPALRGLAGWPTLFSAVLEVVGVDEGATELRAVLEAATSKDAEMAASLEAFLDAVSRRGFLPRRLFFAAKRYRRWEELNPGATPSARARTLQEIYQTYGLDDLTPAYPEARARYFRETVLRNSCGELRAGLEELINQLRRGELVRDELSAAVADLRAHVTLDPEEDFFLARLSYPHLRPEDDAQFVEAAAGGMQQSEMVVTHEDADGMRYQIRHALSAKEVGRLHRLFLTAKLPVQFRPEHRFLVAISDRGSLIGGLFYELEPEAQTAHMDKIVVTEAFQGRGIAARLLEELEHRLRTGGFRSLTTGFFRPQFFYRMGFTVERRYAGLYKSLIEDDMEG